jgi:primosomal protein N' (replication factor Y)
LSAPRFAQVVLDVPLDQHFDFRLGEGAVPAPGTLVIVPFGRGKRVGLVTALADESAVPAAKLRTIGRLIEDIDPLEPAQMQLLAFCAAYYQAPLGEVAFASLPPPLKRVSRRAVKPRAPGPAAPAPPIGRRHELHPEQQTALDAIVATFGHFAVTLLHGVTGSGKTEVYLRLIEETLARGRQALMLVQEIGLTPQLESRVRERFPGVPLALAHSHLSDGERLAAWLAGREGRARIVLGTRLAVLAPLPELGLVIVDEENDPSYKQQEGMRYSARDVAVLRAERSGVPIVLGSATPSLESLNNAQRGRYALARLGHRAVAESGLPVVRTIDTRNAKPEQGLSESLLAALKLRLESGEQSLLFVNRRGYSPVLYCRSCAWHSSCTRCSANLVLHLKRGELRCHHCGHREAVPAHCPGCGSADLAPVGHGTQRLEDALLAAFPAARIVRVDRDSMRRKGALEEVMAKVDAGEIDVLVGTQMLAKGHDYPRLTLVGVVNSDSSLFSADFRAAERLFSQLVQVSGRSGRGATRGEVLIQTDFPDHPLYHAVAAHDFDAFAATLLLEREQAHFPPYAHIALLRAESLAEGEAMRFLRAAAQIAGKFGGDVEVFDPVPAALARRAGHERAQLMVRASRRPALQRLLAAWRPQLESLAERNVRWVLDVDPLDV